MLCLSKVGYITRCKYITSDAEANNADDVLVDFQDAHGFQTVLKSETKLIPFHKYVRIPRKVDTWYTLPMQFHQISLYATWYRDNSDSRIDQFTAENNVVFKIVTARSRLLGFGRN